MILTSTNDIKDFKIAQYLGLINVNVVIGANFFSDFFASFTDVFGGYSNTYQSKLDEIYGDALRELQTKATNTGANAIIGVHFDFDEVSGKGKSMFMVTAYGTAVIIEPLVKEIKKTERYEVYERLYNLSLFKEKGIITEEQYEAERSNLLLNYEDAINQELEYVKSENDHKESVKQAHILAKQHEEERQKEIELLLEKQRQEAEANMTEAQKFAQLRISKEQDIKDAYDRFKVNAPTTIIKIRNLLEHNVKSPIDTLGKLSSGEIMSANYEDMRDKLTDQAAQSIAVFIKYGRIAEACKYYIDLVGDDDIDEAKGYIKSIYEMITFKNLSAFENMAKNLVELKVLGKNEDAALEFAKYSVCDIEVARRIIDLL